MIKHRNGFVESIEIRYFDGSSQTYQGEGDMWFMEFKGTVLEICNNAQNKIEHQADGNHKITIEKRYIPLTEIKEIITQEVNQ